jgi:hypothetical protein
MHTLMNALYKTMALHASEGKSFLSLEHNPET